ncbi:hypothetical protein B0A50_03652 [Salinomyces thailandicus]|uniref:UreD-domain-containing protein n=1 Tax=Salinomyces thailandicus TaxID=706561 RepID=A0A4U0U3P3_9PEZI|nr:hypothetical protein B0A50_03652 [Salinomyces thailandica]
MSNPFLIATAKPGHGTIHLALLPPDTPRLRTASYQYPLKLVSPAATRSENEVPKLVHTVYLLTYGGGLVAGDGIDLSVTLESTTRLILLTQGSTKLFKAPCRDVLSKQCMNVHLAPGSALCYLPDPVQPFKSSCFEQSQIYNISVPEDGMKDTANLCVLDWVCNGRPANGENWSFFRYCSRNEIYLCLPEGKRRLLLRDNIALDDYEQQDSIACRMHGLAAFGTLIIHGPLFKRLGQFFMDEFKALPRIGGRKWDSGSESGDEDVDTTTARRIARQRQETADGLLWSAAAVRGCAVIKFGVKSVEGGKRWLKNILAEDGSVVREFGERALLCLR